MTDWEKVERISFSAGLLAIAIGGLGLLAGLMLQNWHAMLWVSAPATAVAFISLIVGITADWQISKEKGLL